MELNESFEINPKELMEEEQSITSEKEYAGLTQYWLNNTIASLAMISMLHREKKQKSCIKIQAAYRGFKVRKKTRFMFVAIIKIQKTWRGFSARMRFYKTQKEILKLHIEAYHNRSARTIQAAFRGFYSRKYVHDQGKLKRLRVESARELLQCVAIKTRELLKNHQLPGVYSLRNSICLSKVEKLVASLRLKSYNESVKETRAEEIAKLRKAFEKSMRSKYRTEVPFGCCTEEKKQVDSFAETFHQLRRSKKSDEDEENKPAANLSDLSLQLYKKRATRELSGNG